jgi:hypothetical protein
MKKIFRYTLGITAMVLLFAACEKNEPIVFDNKDSFIGFVRPAGAVAEARMVAGEPVENVLAIPIMLVTLDNTPVTVNFDFSVEGIREEAQAIEGDAFVLLNETKTLSFNGGLAAGSAMGYDTIFIRTVDDEIFTGNRQVNINLLSNSGNYPFGTQKSFRLTIIDNEHPLNIVLGVYDVAAVSEIWPDDANTVIQTSAVDGTLTQVSFPLNQLVLGWNIPASYLVYANVDVEEKTFNIQIGQDYPSFAHGPFKITGFDGTTGTRMDDGLFVRGTFDDDGNIVLHDKIGLIITEAPNLNYQYERLAPGSVWTKRLSKNQTVETMVNDNNVKDPNLQIID